MNMLGNYLDLIVIIYLSVAFLSGYRKRSSDMVLALLSVVVALIAGLLTFDLTAFFLEKNFQIPTAYGNVAGFFFNALAFKSLANLAFKRLFAKLGWSFELAKPLPRRMLGAFLGALYGLLAVFVIASIFVSLTLPGMMVAQIENSRFGGFINQDPAHLNDNFSEIFGGILAATLKDFSFMAIRTGSEEKVDLGFQALEVAEDPDAEMKMLELVNQERTSRGLKALVMNEEARRAARDYGRYLFKNGIFSHIDLEGKGPADRMANYDVTFMMTGENLAYAPGLEEAHQGLMNSESHRENILHPFFGRVGIGVIDGGPYGKIYVQEFLD